GIPRMISLLAALLVLPAVANAVECYHCSNRPTNIPCNASNICEGTTCFIVQEKYDFYAGCSTDQPVARTTCHANSKRSVCGCSSPKCNHRDQLGDGVEIADFNPFHSIKLSTFFENLTAVPVVPVPPPSTESTAAPNDDKSKGTTMEAPANATDATIPPPDLTTKKPDGGSTASLLLGVAIVGTILLC
ncbi:hypothetical protein PFISCL1PPCAC_6793, partial [Pristionchus fissidentatus]